MDAICDDLKVVIRCWTYNQASYIQQCLDGFTMQKTNFPFAAIVVDDASTDNEPELLWDFINNELVVSSLQKDETEDYVKVVATHKINLNCKFIFLFLKYNHYSIKKNKKPYLKTWEDKTKYIAHCEGDDYWTDPLKLQKQVDFMESHPDFTMVCNRTKLYSEKQKKYIGENYCYNKSRVVNPKDVIFRTGLYISTCSILLRKEIIDNIPDYWAKCKVGDYPLQIMCAMKGDIYYFNDIMSVYRVQNANSWTGQQKWFKLDKGRIEVLKSQIVMFNGFAHDFPKYKRLFKNKIANQINRSIPLQLSEQEEFLSFFSEEIQKYSLLQRVDLFIRKLLRRKKYKKKYENLFQSKYNLKQILY